MRTQRTALIIFIVFAAALLLRVINLDADPSTFISRDFITDEGWWAHNARNATLFGQWRIDDYNLGLYSAYLYNALLYFIFEMFGISFTTVRVLSAITGWLTVVLLFLLVRREIGPRAALFASALLGFSNLHIIYSRTGFVECTMVFFLVLALWLWSLRAKHALYSLMSGVAFALLLVTKMTAIYVLPGVIILIVVASIRRTVRRQDVLAFITGVGLVGAAYAILFVVPNFDDWLRFNVVNGSGAELSTGLAGRLKSILRLLGSSFYAEAPLITALTLLSMCLFVVSASRIGLLKTIRDARELEVTTAALLIGYLFSLSVAVYQPQRRFIPALCLMIILSAGVLDKGWAFLKGLEKEERMGAVGLFTVLFLLPAVGVLEMRLRMLSVAGSWALKVFIIAGLVAIAVGLSRGRWSPLLKRNLMVASRLIFVLLFSVLSLALIYKSLLLWGLDVTLWRGSVYKAVIASSIVVVICGVIVLLLSRDAPRATSFLLCGVLFVEGAQISTWLLQPTYTLREASSSLANTMTRDDTIVTYYETVLLSSTAKIIRRSPRGGFNLEVFETSSPQYILVLRRDNWMNYTLEEMPPEEWPPPVRFVPTRVAGFEVCPTRLRGPRFILELYSLGPHVKTHKAFPDNGSE